MEEFTSTVTRIEVWNYLVENMPIEKNLPTIIIPSGEKYFLFTRERRVAYILTEHKLHYIKEVHHIH